MLAAVVVAGLTGCSIHPIADDVSPIPTENIVAAARCELRLALANKVDVWLFKDAKLPRSDPLLKPDFVGENGNLEKIAKRYPYPKYYFRLDDWKSYMAISVAYEWTFDITETNQVDGSVGFRLPFMNYPGGTLDAGASGRVNTIRRGTRTFKNQDTLGNMLTEHWSDICNDEWNSGDETNIQPIPQPRRILYPITGSIGLEKVIKTFLSVASWDDAVDTFVDEIAFTTTLDARAGATIALNPVPQKFRVVNASANLAGTRVDLHKVKVSLAFPKARPTQKTSKQLGKELDQRLEEAIGGYALNPNWRAAYALCVAAARSREEDFKTLRLDPPEVTCVASTDAFFPRGDGWRNSLRTGRYVDLLQEQSAEKQRKLDDHRRKEEMDQMNQQKKGR